MDFLDSPKQRQPSALHGLTLCFPSSSPLQSSSSSRHILKSMTTEGKQNIKASSQTDLANIVLQVASFSSSKVKWSLSKSRVMWMYECIFFTAIIWLVFFFQTFQNSRHLCLCLLSQISWFTKKAYEGFTIKRDRVCTAMVGTTTYTPRGERGSGG